MGIERIYTKTALTGLKQTDMGCIGVVMALKHTLVVTGRGTTG